MTEASRIADQIKRALVGPAWSGPSLMEILLEITHVPALRKLSPETHSIWEIVLHIEAWESIVRRRIEGELLVDVGTQEDWPAISETTAEAWALAIEQLEVTNRFLQRTVLDVADERLREPVQGKDYTLYVMLHGSVQHTLYHAGQIAILKRLVQTDTASRVPA